MNLITICHHLLLQLHRFSFLTSLDIRFLLWEMGLACVLGNYCCTCQHRQTCAEDHNVVLFPHVLGRPQLRQWGSGTCSHDSGRGAGWQPDTHRAPEAPCETTVPPRPVALMSQVAKASQIYLVHNTEFTWESV